MKADTPIIVIVGPTAIGKTEISLRVAERFACEIVSVDSMQVYRYLDIGTAKPTAAQLARIPHHLIDIVDPDEDYTVARFAEDTSRAVDLIVGRGKIPLLAGGTGMYLRGFLDGVFADERAEDKVTGNASADREIIRAELKKRLSDLGKQKMHDDLRLVDPPSAERIHPNDTQRLLRALEIYHSTGIPWSKHLELQQRNNSVSSPIARPLKLGLTCERDLLYKRINERVELMLEQGLLGEVEELLARGFNSSMKSMQAIGYRHMLNFLEGKWDWDSAVELLARDTRHYAKRQYTWFRRDQEIKWFYPEQQEELFSIVESYLDCSKRQG